MEGHRCIVAQLLIIGIIGVYSQRQEASPSSSDQLSIPGLSKISDIDKKVQESHGMRIRRVATYPADSSLERAPYEAIVTQDRKNRRDIPEQSRMGSERNAQREDARELSRIRAERERALDVAQRERDLRERKRLAQERAQRNGQAPGPNHLRRRV